jgi:hypothetical protein
VKTNEGGEVNEVNKMDNAPTETPQRKRIMSNKGMGNAPWTPIPHRTAWLTEDNASRGWGAVLSL